MVINHTKKKERWFSGRFHKCVHRSRSRSPVPVSGPGLPVGDNWDRTGPGFFRGGNDWDRTVPSCLETGSYFFKKSWDNCPNFFFFNLRILANSEKWYDKDTDVLCGQGGSVPGWKQVAFSTNHSNLSGPHLITMSWVEYNDGIVLTLMSTTGV